MVAGVGASRPWSHAEPESADLRSFWRFSGVFVRGGGVDLTFRGSEPLGRSTVFLAHSGPTAMDEGGISVQNNAEEARHGGI
jgi:hypothetical protein